MAARHKNTLEKARLIQALVREHYEPGRQDRCKLWVYRNVVNKVYPMSVPTFFRYLAIDVEGAPLSDTPDQLKLPWCD